MLAWKLLKSKNLVAHVRSSQFKLDGSVVDIYTGESTDSLIGFSLGTVLDDTGNQLVPLPRKKINLPISWVVSVDVSVDDVVATDTSVIFEVLLRQRPN